MSATPEQPEPRPEQPEPDADAEVRGPKAASSSSSTAAFLPIGLVFMILGISQGLGESQGVTFFAVGVVFLSLAPGGTRRSRGEQAAPPVPPPAPEPRD